MTENKHNYIGDRNEDGQRHGNGMCTYNNGDKYIGEWHEDYKHGNGIYIFADGEKYVGEYKYDKKDGHGEYTFASGEKYIGEWKDNKYHGQGEFAFADGAKYIGEFKDDNRDGQGEHTFANGEKYVGEYKDDIRDGQGELTFANGEKYIGEFKDGKYHGQGEYTFADGAKYIGEYKDDRRDGHGEYTFADGTVVKKFYKDGEEISEEEHNRLADELTETAQKEIEEDPSYTIEILEEFLDYEIPPASKLEHLQAEIENAEEELLKLETDLPQMTRLANRVKTKIRELREIIKDKNIKERPFPIEKYQLDGTSKREYLNSRKDYLCGLCGKYHLVFKTKDSKKWTCPGPYCKGSQWPNFAEMEFLNITYKR